MTTENGNAQPNIIRAEHSTEQHYFIMRRDTAQDNGLSFEARGVIAYLLSKPSDWTINETELQKAGGIGRQKMRKVIAELVEKGYMQKSAPQRDPDTKRFLPTVFTLYEAKTEAVYEKPSTASRQREIIQLQSKEVKSKEEKTTGAKSAPDAGAVVSDLADTPTVIDPGDVVDEALLAGMLDDPDPVPDDFKAIQEYTVVTVFKGNKAMYGKAGDIANWALCRNDKPQWVEWKPERPFTMYEWITFLAWYAVKDIAWPSSGEKWNKQAFEWRDCGDYHSLINPRPIIEPVTFIHDPTCTACNYGMVIDGAGKSLQCPQCAPSKEKESV